MTTREHAVADAPAPPLAGSSREEVRVWHEEFLAHAQLVVAYHTMHTLMHTLMGLLHVRADRTQRAARARRRRARPPTPSRCPSDAASATTASIR
jgi:hypothetical protein